jgi:hypothetical protein
MGKDETCLSLVLPTLQISSAPVSNNLEDVMKSENQFKGSPPNLKKRSSKSKEKFADSLMAIANAIHSAAFVGVLVLPLTAFVSAMFSGNEPFSFLSIINKMTWPRIGIFALVYLSPIILASLAKEKAMDIYDEVARLANNSTKQTSKNFLRVTRSGCCHR